MRDLADIEIDWWENPDRMKELIALAQTVLCASKGRHIIGLGQSAYFPLVAMNLLHIEAHGTPLSYSAIPMSGRILQPDIMRFGENGINITFELDKEAGTNAGAITKLSENLGKICDVAHEDSKAITLFDCVASTASLASASYMLDMYDTAHETNYAANARSIGYDHIEPADTIDGIMVTRIPSLRCGTRIISTQVFITSNQLYRKLGQSNNIIDEHSDRVVPYTPPCDWGKAQALRPNAPVPAQITLAIQAAVARL